MQPLGTLTYTIEDGDPCWRDPDDVVIKFPVDSGFYDVRVPASRDAIASRDPLFIGYMVSDARRIFAQQYPDQDIPDPVVVIPVV